MGAFIYVNALFNFILKKKVCVTHTGLFFFSFFDS